MTGFRTISLTIDADLLGQIDATSKQLGLSCNAFIHQALRQELERVRIAEMERQHAAGHARRPVETGEFDVWQAEQAWTTHGPCPSTSPSSAR
jgi:hypothetical protein